MAPQESLLKTYGDRSYRHVTMARHQGTTIAFAMDSTRRIVYSVLDMSGQHAKGDIDTAYWSGNPAEPAFPREIAEVGFAVVGATAMPTVKRGGAEAGADERPLPGEIDPYLSTTARLTADAPFHVISDGTYVVVLRQSVGETDPGAVYKLTGGGCSRDASRGDYVLSGAKKVPLVRDTRCATGSCSSTGSSSPSWRCGSSAADTPPAPSRPRTTWAPRTWRAARSTSRPRSCPSSGT
ncbi:hypothetical protein ACIRYZ_24340 [Kitasatospora sp. NPDC101155]|uniref:hypothetical protein n=1 Tax=Kitasatospora sp. NPDC101155 TaxID=3364097 RepID=UPI003820E15F